MGLNNKDIFKERQNELDTIMRQLDKTNNTLSETKDEINLNFKAVKNFKENNTKNYLEKREELVGNMLVKLEEVNEYNKLLYSVEYNRYQMKLARIDEKVKYNYLYLERCIKYIKYLQAYFRGNEFLKLQSYYDLVNALQTEILEKETNRINIGEDRINLNGDYKKITENKYCKGINFNILSDSNEAKIKESIISSKKNKENYINMFREEKLVLDDDVLINTSFMNYIVEELVELLYKNNIGKDNIQEENKVSEEVEIKTRKAA